MRFPRAQHAARGILRHHEAQCVRTRAAEADADHRAIDLLVGDLGIVLPALLELETLDEYVDYPFRDDCLTHLVQRGLLVQRLDEDAETLLPGVGAEIGKASLPTGCVN